MDTKTLAIVGLGLLALVMLSNNANAAPSGNLNMDLLTDDPGDQQRLNSIYQELLARGYTTQQILFMMAQLLFESGILTNVGNYSLMNQNNYAGLTKTTGGYASYNSISDFVDAYDGFLTKGSDPLGATSLTDFNNRLVANHYYTEDPNVYYNGLLSYYRMLSSTIGE